MTKEDALGTESMATSDLLGARRESYGQEYAPHLLEQYKLYVQMADKISDRRQATNTFALTLNTGLIAALAAMISRDPTWLSTKLYVVVCSTGVVSCFAWHRLIQSYRDLNGGKFRIIHELEGYLPVRPYDCEWTLVGRGKLKALYFPFTHIETRIPWAFAMMYFAIIVILLFSEWVPCVR